jgi:putative transposase
MYVSRRITSQDVMDRLYELSLSRETPEHIRSDTGSESTTYVVIIRLRDLSATTLYIEPGSPCANGYVESYIRKFRDEPLSVEILETLMEMRGVLPPINKAESV